MFPTIAIAHLVRALCALVRPPTPAQGCRTLCAHHICTRCSSTLCVSLCVPCAYLVRTLCVPCACTPCAQACARPPLAQGCRTLVRRAMSLHKVVHKATILANGRILIRGEACSGSLGWCLEILTWHVCGSRSG